jgi:Sulfotransferase family
MSAAMHVDALVDDARRNTSLENFGDERFREPLAVLLDAVVTEANLTEQALAGQRQSLVHALEVRLRAQQYFDTHSEIAAEHVSPAFVIVGPQRSGTSKLFRLVAADPRWTKLYTWQALNPIPTGAPVPAGEEDPRIADAEAFVEQMRWLQPAHEMDARAPEMEAMLMAQAFMTNSPTCIVPSHQRYCAQVDQAAVYDWLHSMLQFIQWQNGGERRPWILKSPTHLPTLRELHRQYPDSVLVMTHRHPLTSVASMFKLVELGTQNSARAVDRTKIRDFWLTILLLNMQRFLDMRDQATATWVDVPYPELVDDSMRSVERIYSAAGADLSPESAEELLRWETENPPHKQGDFSYRLEDYGMTETDVEREFSGYISRFGHLF